MIELNIPQYVGGKKLGSIILESRHFVFTKNIFLLRFIEFENSEDISLNYFIAVQQ